MIDNMGIFRTTISVENPTRPGVVMRVENVMVDTGSEYTWLPRTVLETLDLVPTRTVRFITADGRQVERAVCFGNVYAGGSSAPDILVFADPDDMVLLGARALEGMNLRVDMLAKQLVPAGPVPAAAA
ncbi:MAG TPA: aspartyl protease family protein [Gemmatimonadaceae bacterium]|jgi:predicted aspartyl protease